MPRVLITGANGFVGSMLAESYLQKGWIVHGTVRERSNLAFLEGIKDKIVLHVCDIRDAHGVYRIVSEIYDVIHHLAAQTYVPSSWSSPTETFETNVIGSLNILEAVRLTRGRYQNPIIHIAGSSEEYGFVKEDEVPIKETNPLRPSSPYGVSKVAADLLFQQYHRSYDMRTLITRSFNHTQIRRGGHFVSKTVCRQAAEIKKGKRDAFFLGNLDPVRDFTDGRDMVEAYHLAVEKCELGEPYNICTGVGYAVKELVNAVSNIAGIEAQVKQDPAKMRPSDVPILLGDNTKFVDATGWKPKYTMLDTLKDIYEWELGAIQS